MEIKIIGLQELEKVCFFKDFLNFYWKVMKIL